MQSKDKDKKGKQVLQNNPNFNQTNIQNNSQNQSSSSKQVSREPKGKEESHSLVSKLQEAVEAIEVDPSFKHKLNITLNNLNDSSIQDTSAKVCALLQDPSPKEKDSREHREQREAQLLQYFAEQLVVMRIVKETNQQNVYEKMITLMSEKVDNLQEVLLEELQRAINCFLQSDNTQEDKSMDKKQLNNLGSFLGLMTLKRNASIAHNHLDLKKLLIESQQVNKHQTILSFVIRIIESSKQSVYFKDFNCPQLNVLLNIIQEIYYKNNQQNNIVKTNIQVFFYGLGQENIFLAPNPRTNQLASAKPEEGETFDSNFQQPQQVPKLGMSHVQPNKKNSQINFIQNNVKISDAISAQQNDTKENFKMLVTISIERSLREIISPVVERSYLIANTTTQYLVSKDFNGEQANNNNLYKESAVNMSHHLSSNLALVTCREPLRISLMNCLNEYFKSNNDKLKEDAQVESLIKDLVNDNLDVGCSFIVKQVQEKNFPEQEVKWSTDIFKELPKELQQREDSLPDALKPQNVRNPKNKNYMEFYKKEQELKKKLNTEQGNFEEQQMYGGQPNFVNSTTVNPSSSTNVSTLNNVSTLPTASMSQLLGSLKNQVEKVIEFTPSGPKESILNSHQINEYRNRITTLLQNKTTFLENTNNMQTAFVSWILESYSDPNKAILDLKLQVFMALFKEFKNIIQSNMNYSQIESKCKATMCKYFRDVLSKEAKFREANLKGLTLLLEEGFLTWKDVDVIFYELEDLKLVHEYFKHFKAKEDLSHQLPSTWEKLAKLNSNVNFNLTGPENTNSLSIDREHLLLIKDSVPSIHKFIEDWKDEILMQISYNQKIVEKHIEELIQISEKIKIEGKDIEYSYALVLFEMLQQCFRKTNVNFKQHENEPEFQHQVQIDAFAKLIFACLTQQSNFKNFDNNLFAMLVSFFDILLQIFKLNQQSAHFKQLQWLRLFMSIFNEFSLIEELRNILTIKQQIFRQIIKKLVEINPNKQPKFAFAFFELVSQKKFFPFLKDKSEDLLPLLNELIRFVQQVSKQPGLQGSESFESIKDCLQRIVQMVAHDFPELVMNNLQSLLSLVPDEMIQLKNMLLSDFNPEVVKNERQLINEQQENVSEIHELSKNVLVEECVKERVKEFKLEQLHDQVVAHDKNTDEQVYNLLKFLKNQSEEPDNSKRRLYRLIIFQLVQCHQIVLKDEILKAKLKQDKEISSRIYKLFEYILLSRTKRECELFITCLVDLLGHHSFVTQKGLMLTTLLAVETKRTFVRERILEEVLSRAEVGEPIPLGIKLFLVAGNKPNSSLKLRDSVVFKRNAEQKKILDREDFRN